MGATNSPERPDQPDAQQDLPNPEAALGGADNVQKTSYVTGSGTEPGARNDDQPIARMRSGGFSIGGWLLILVVVAIALFYGGSLFS